MPDISDEIGVDGDGSFREKNGNNYWAPKQATRLVYLTVQDLKNLQYSTEELFVFGYASLIWKPGFLSTHSYTGYIPGFIRRFNQANRVQRGTSRQPGRVATLEEDSDGRTWGVCYQLKGPEQVGPAIDHLIQREVTNGNYTIAFQQFYPRSGGAPFKVLLFYGAPQGADYLGEAPLQVVADQIRQAEGTCGSNSEYVTKLARYVRQYIPEDDDPHLFQLADMLQSDDY